jgi:transcription antitermination protein NusB
MISRRSIRVKVLQALYSQIILQNDNEKEAIDIYDKSIIEVLQVNLCYLQYAVETIGYVKEYAKQQSEKHLISEADKVFNQAALSMKFYTHLTANELLTKSIKKYKIDLLIQSEYVRNMFFELIKLREYTDYVQEPSDTKEYHLLNTFFKRILFKNEDLAEYLETSYGNVDEDADLVHFTLKRSIKALLDGKPLAISLGFEEMKYLEDFAYNLTKITLKKQAEYSKIIDPKLVGWDADRIPVLDMTIIKMAMSEMLHFPTIPLKVTVNEYIDLSKIFCSVKSKDFVNGIMDRIMKELQADGKILKTGRGLD